MFYAGNGVPQNFKEAVKWFRLAVEQGVPEAEWRLGLCFERGQGVPADVEQAVLHYRRAADRGFEIAIGELRRLGRLTAASSSTPSSTPASTAFTGPPPPVTRIV